MSRDAYVAARGAQTDALSDPVDLRKRSTPLHRPVGGLAKRATDVALAAIALVLLAPMFLLIAVLLYMGLRRSVFVVQQRIGFAGRRFTAYSFRTSPNDDVRDLADEPALATCLVGVVRDSGLDRLPQLISILRGDMSFVGPQPISLDCSGQGRPDYFSARPGLIDMCRPDEFGRLGDCRRAAVDRYYVRRWTIWLDLALIAGSLLPRRIGSP